MTQRFLNDVYAARDAEETETLYDAWAGSYEDEVAEQGYATPARCAEALAQHMGDTAKPILDFGCGTGLSGLALAQRGFSAIDGVDLSAEMLERAKGKNVYRALRQISADENPVTPTGAYAAIAAIGVIGAGAAPIETADTLLSALPSNGFLVLSFNDHALEDPANEGCLERWFSQGIAELLSKSYGPHLPGIGLQSNVYVIRKT